MLSTEGNLRRWVLGLTLSSWFLLVPASGQTSVFKGVREKFAAQDYNGALSILEAVKVPLSPIQVGQKSFAEGVAAFELEKYDVAQTKLLKALTFPGPLEYYVRYYLGRVLQAKKQYKEADAEYQRALKLRPPQHLGFMIKFQASEMAMDRKWWAAAYNELHFLERHWRRDENYPEVLWRLIDVESQRARKWRACHWARKLYAKYPSHPLIDDWGIDLPSAPYKGKKMDCLVTINEQKERIRRLQWAGESERARKELDTLRSRAKGEPATFVVDLMLANFLISDGFASEALKVLLPHYEKHKSSFGYLEVLGKAAARAGEYQTAVGAYQRAHDSSPKSRSGREALFQAAFLSYQFQDYDGASRKFEKLITKYPNSGLSRDSKWHLSWIRYLKGDYQGAIGGFDEILNIKKDRRARRGWRNFSNEKINYWKAMALFRMEKFDEARAIFAALSKDHLVDYYTIAAKNRLGMIPDLEQNRRLASTGSEEPIKGGLEKIIIDEAGNSPEAAPAVNGDVASAATNAIPEEEESEDNISITADEAAGEEASADSPEELPKTEGSEEKTVAATDFKDPELRLRFERASLLVEIGLLDWARWELYEIERRTRNQDYLKMLMAAYEQIDSYYRSSYIGIIHFSGQRGKYGIEGVRYLWEYAYPRAYRPSVEKYTSDFGVEKEFAWGIMRAESSFRHDVISPVGAKGLMQLMPNTARQMARLMGDASFNDRRLTEPEVNIRIGIRYLQRLLGKFDNMVPLAAAAYNAGPHRVESWLASFGKLEMDEFVEHIPFIETRNYVKKVLRNYAIYASLYNKAGPEMDWLTQPIKVEITRPSQRETWESL